MELKAGVTHVGELDVETFMQAAEQAGWRVFVLMDAIESRAELFAAIRARLPLDPPLHSDRSWDALADSLWEGIDLTSEDRIVIVWPNASKLRAAAAADYQIAVDILSEIAASTARDKQLSVIIADGP